jgi:hypothetical protein
MGYEIHRYHPGYQSVPRHSERSAMKRQLTGRNTGQRLQHAAVIRRGILIDFHATNYTADVLLLEATATYLQNVPVAYHIDGTSAQKKNLCAVLFFDVQNYSDAVVLAVFPNVDQGAPTYSPGRVTLVPAFTLASGDLITTVIGDTNGIPSGTLGTFLSAHFTSSSVGAWVTITAVGGNGITLGNMYSSGGYINGAGLVPLNQSGQIDVRAHSGDCHVTIGVYGYVF